ncbi:MAG TPA: MerR family transcriptional regulator, partial [Nitriliruptorales bacterium]|nr:MerR family transcriptional regulator [Nitriliruptorales bacterium]
MSSRGGTVRISELSRTTGVSVATIKYYLREGLLPPGQATAPNQADYSDVHVHRLRLVRVLREVGGLRIDAIREVVRAVEDPERSLHEVLGVAHRAISPGGAACGPSELAEVDELLAHLGWEVSPDAPDRHELAGALASLRSLGRDVDVRTFLPYAHAVEPLAGGEVQSLRADTPAEVAVEHAVVGTVVYGAALAALRRLAQEHHSGRRHGRSRR